MTATHKQPGDARSPSDTLRDDEQDEGKGNAKTQVEDRPNVSTVRPEDYPNDARPPVS